MSLKWGGKGEKIRDTVVQDNGLYEASYHIGEAQSMCFKETDDGPFYLTLRDRQEQRYPTLTGQQITRQKTKAELVQDLKRAGFNMRGHYTMDDLIQHASNNHMPLSVTHEVIKPDWVGASKGLLQILWGRGYVDAEKCREYTLDGKKS